MSLLCHDPGSQILHQDDPSLALSTLNQLQETTECSRIAFSSRPPLQRPHSHRPRLSPTPKIGAEAHSRSVQDSTVSVSAASIGSLRSALHTSNSLAAEAGLARLRCAP